MYYRLQRRGPPRNGRLLQYQGHFESLIFIIVTKGKMSLTLVSRRLETAKDHVKVRESDDANVGDHS